MELELTTVLKVIEPLAASMGYEVLKAEFTQDHGRKILRIYIDKEGGVVIGDCERFSQTLSPILDVEGEIQGRYDLEVSSPGLNRPLRLPKHFSSQVGKIIQVTTEDPIEERRNFKGELTRVEGDSDGFIEVLVDQKLFQISYKNIKKAHLDFFATEERQKESVKSSKNKKKI